MKIKIKKHSTGLIEVQLGYQFKQKQPIIGKKFVIFNSFLLESAEAKSLSKQLGRLA